jgi:hypothetical protein
LASQLCSRCVLSNSYPGLFFDDHGVCSICREYDQWTHGWKLGLPQRKKILKRICKQAKNKHKEFDALIPFSGGKDSTYVLYIAKKELELNCLAYTFDNGYLSKYAKTNIEKTCRKLGVEHVSYRLNPNLLNDLYALFVRKTGYPCSVCMRGIAMGTDKLAELYDIPLIISGSSPRTELMGTPEMSEHGLIAHVRAVLEGEPIAKKCKRLLFTYSLRRKFGHLLFYLARKKRLITYAWFRLADYIDWNYDIIQDTIRRELAWSAPKYSEHMDCIIHPIQKYIQIRRFPDLSLDRMRFARLIMAGQMSREQALQQLERTRVHNPKTELELFLKNIKMTREEFDNYIDLGPRHIQYNSQTLLEKMINKISSLVT